MGEKQGEEVWQCEHLAREEAAHDVFRSTSQDFRGAEDPLG